MEVLPDRILDDALYIEYVGELFAFESVQSGRIDKPPVIFSLQSRERAEAQQLVVSVSRQFRQFGQFRMRGREFQKTPAG